MILELSSALKHPGQSFPFSVEGNINELDLYGDTIKLDNPVKVEGTIMYTGEDFFVRGSLDVDYSTDCALCFKEVNENVSFSFNEEYCVVEDEHHPDRYNFTGNTIDITKMVIDNICLNVPLKHLCTKDCKGLCPDCGVNLNNNNCDCDAKIDESSFDNKAVINKKENPFAVLENLFSDKDDEEA